MEIIIIAAMASNRVIGNSQTNDIPWNLPKDQQLFKQITMGWPMVMGRRTYQSIGRPLPGRQMIVVTRNKDFAASGCQVVTSLDQALQLCRHFEKVFVIGGAEIYKQSLPRASRIILTVLARAAEGDVLFPDFCRDAFYLHRVAQVMEPELYEVRTYLRKE